MAPGWLQDAMRRMAIVGAHDDVVVHQLSGGVSSDIYRVDLPSATLCVKRALPKLKVAADWRAPIERNHNEAEWMRVVATIAPAAVPELIAEDAESNAFAMAYLPPERYPVWKERLRDGAIDVRAAATIGDVLGRIHAATADQPAIAERFATDRIFEAIRIEPYLIATARVHGDLATALYAIAGTTRTTKRALVHGDFSPKNILLGPHGPVIVDAECAWYGDPAFDLAFVLNHLLLKGVWRPQWRSRYVEAFVALEDAYVMHVEWEPREALSKRTAALLPALMLARIDGHSPVEYVQSDEAKDEVRTFARAILVTPVEAPSAIARRWMQ